MELEMILMIGVAAAALVYVIVVNRDYKKATAKLIELQSPDRMKLYEEGYTKASEEKKLLLNLVANLSAFLYTSIPVSPEAKETLEQITKLLNEVRDGVPVETKLP